MELYVSRKFRNFLKLYNGRLMERNNYGLLHFDYCLLHYEMQIKIYSKPILHSTLE